MTAERARRRVVVSGRVQGVFFRRSTLDVARALALGGWVSNRDDGAVEAVFEGEQDAVEEAVRFCRTGPAGARVDDVDVREERPEGLERFVVR